MNYIKGFDGLRAISIILVILTHLGIYSAITIPFVNYRILPLINGGTGVNIFFSISGFLITRILLIDKSLNRLSLKKFYIRRFLRLFPPLFILFVIIISLMIGGLITKSYVGVVFSFFYVYNFIPNIFYTGELGHTWSLGVEEQFYLFWPIIILLIKDKTRIVLFAILIITLCVAFSFLLNKFYFHYHSKVYYFGSLFKLQRWFIPAVGPIMIGSIFSVIIFYSKAWLNNFINNFGLFLIAILYISPLFLPIVMLPISYLFQSLGITFLLVWLINNQEKKLTNILEYKPLAYIGKISYGLYVYQGIFLRTGPAEKDAIIIQQFPYNILLTFIVAIISYEFFEKKILLLKNKFR